MKHALAPKAAAAAVAGDPMAVVAGDPMVVVGLVEEVDDVDTKLLVSCQL